MAAKIPDRWLSYRPVGKRVQGTRFIAFKVPLTERVNRNVEQRDRLDAKILLEKVPNLGVIIDLTNTNRYYDPIIFKTEGIQHIKLMIPGHVTPPPHLVDKFKRFVKEFLQDNENNDKLIGVHCTHGVNRTGYLICNYMVSELDVAPQEAIDNFADARGHKIERQNYLAALRMLPASIKGTSGSYSRHRDEEQLNLTSSRGSRDNYRHRDGEQLHLTSSRGARDNYRHKDGEQLNLTSSRGARDNYRRRNDSPDRYHDEPRFNWRHDKFPGLKASTSQVGYASRSSDWDASRNHYDRNPRWDNTHYQSNSTDTMDSSGYQSYPQSRQPAHMPNRGGREMRVDYYSSTKRQQNRQQLNDSRTYSRNTRPSYRNRET